MNHQFGDKKGAPVMFRLLLIPDGTRVVYALKNRKSR